MENNYTAERGHLQVINKFSKSVYRGVSHSEVAHDVVVIGGLVCHLHHQVTQGPGMSVGPVSVDLHLQANWSVSMHT